MNRYKSARHAAEAVRRDTVMDTQTFAQFDLDGNQKLVRAPST